MADEESPRLRTVNKVAPPYPLNRFPNGFPTRLGREIVYLLATKANSSLEGPEWEEIFATCIGAKWKPSNVGLDDVVLGSCAWGAKSVKAPNPETTSRVRLISGRNSPIYSYGDKTVADAPPHVLGDKILGIWNERVSSVRKLFKHVRTVVLVKSNNLLTLCVFEFDTIRYEPERYKWQWNKNRNLQGFDDQGEHRFTWQPHGSQFTIVEDVPADSLIVKINAPKRLNKAEVLKSVGFDPSWITVKKRNG